MAAVQPVNVVVRTLHILRALNRQAISSLDALHRQTGIPKPSIVRLLRTLESEGLVKQAPQYGAYYLTSGVTALANGYHSEPRIVQVSAGIADALTQQFKWPVSVAVQEGDAMIVRYSTIPNSPLSFFHSTINMRLCLLSQALGRAYLAFCDPESQSALIAMLDRLETPAMSKSEISTMLAQTLERGYALRDPRTRPESSTLAVPIFENQRVIATIGLTWFSSAMTQEQAVDRFLAPLQRCSINITASLETLPAGPYFPPHGKS
jgi:IclR family transcriptional regulator, mhp operon transcriptional activator